MSGTLDGKVAIVTGAAQGIGEVYARTLARDGASVALVDLKEDAARANAERIESEGGRAIAVAADIADPASIANLVETTAKELGGIDILVNNAAIYEGYESHVLEEIPLDYWNRFLDVNTTSALLTMQAVVPYMRQRGGGRIVNQSSDAADLCINQYGITKLLLQGQTVGFARELGGDGITVNAIAPGPIDTPATMDNYKDRGIGHFLAGLAIKRMGTPQDLAEMLAFLVSDKGEWITGQIIHVNGGFLTRPG
ncbi:MAG: 3-oxoacyl-[acyl-carrier protein] reductase [Gaiellaceae bacterium]|nr:3-oxoacyl-[acyl-carrier protein] reductase [Gaiellaceae bacterium]